MAEDSRATYRRLLGDLQAFCDDQQSEIRALENRLDTLCETVRTLRAQITGDKDRQR